MRPIFAALLGLAMALPAPAAVQAQTPEPTAAASKSRRAAKPAREPTAGQMAARERQKKCGAEWRHAKVKGSSVGVKWPG